MVKEGEEVEVVVQPGVTIESQTVSHSTTTTAHSVESCQRINSLLLSHFHHARALSKLVSSTNAMHIGRGQEVWSEDDPSSHACRLGMVGGGAFGGRVLAEDEVARYVNNVPFCHFL